MEIRPTTLNEAAMGLGNYVAKITYADLVTAGGSGTTATLAIFPQAGTAAAGTICECIGSRLVTPFDASDASINSLLVEVGIGGATAAQLAQTQLALDGTEIFYKAGTGVPVAFNVADTLDALFTVAGGASPTMGELTVGEVWLFFNVANLAGVGT